MHPTVLRDLARDRQQELIRNAALRRPKSRIRRAVKRGGAS